MTDLGANSHFYNAKADSLRFFPTEGGQACHRPSSHLQPTLRRFPPTAQNPAQGRWGLSLRFSATQPAALAGAKGSESMAPDTPSHSQSEGGAGQQPIRRRRRTRRPTANQKAGRPFKLWAAWEPAVSGGPGLRECPWCGSCGRPRCRCCAGRAGGGLSSGPPRAPESTSRPRGPGERRGAGSGSVGTWRPDLRPRGAPGPWLEEVHCLSRSGRDPPRAVSRGSWGRAVTCFPRIHSSLMEKHPKRSEAASVRVSSNRECFVAVGCLAFTFISLLGRVCTFS